MCSQVAKNLEKINNIINSYNKDVTLIAVSKKQPLSRIKDALNANHKVFGENRVQEAKDKWWELKRDYQDVELHLIGPLQSNKVKDAVALFDVIQTIDREKIINKVAQEAKSTNKHIDCYIQVNIGKEEQKSGVNVEELSKTLSYAIAEGLNVIGLMCIPPNDNDPSVYFEQMLKLAKKHNLLNISMGMSGDYKEAIKCGATHIRLGTSIFGQRNS